MNRHLVLAMAIVNAVAGLVGVLSLDPAFAALAAGNLLFLAGVLVFKATA